MQLPEEDRYSHNREYLLARIAVLMGGRIAEEVFMRQMTTGAANDFEHATDLAQKMVQRWGMSEALGPRVYGDNDSEVFLGRDVVTHRNLSNATAEQVDKEVSRIIQEQYKRAHQIIIEHRGTIEIMAKTLLEWETLESSQIDDIMAGNDPRPPAPSNDGGPPTDSGDAEMKEDKATKPGIDPNIDLPAGHSA
jgi:cell division protease FtsH